MPVSGRTSRQRCTSLSWNTSAPARRSGPRILDQSAPAPMLVMVVGLLSAVHAPGRTTIKENRRVRSAPAGVQAKTGPREFQVSFDARS